MFNRYVKLAIIVGSVEVFGCVQTRHEHYAITPPIHLENINNYGETYDLDHAPEREKYTGELLAQLQYHNIQKSQRGTSKYG